MKMDEMVPPCDDCLRAPAKVLANIDEVRGR
jgi:hypothetical protein